MSLWLSKEILEDIAPLVKLSPENFTDICNVSFNNIQNGITNKKILSKKAEQFGVGVEQFISAINGLSEILIEASKKDITPTDFGLSLADSKLPQQLQKILTEFYTNNSREIRKYLSSMSLKFPSYHNLDWRLDIQLGSRCLRNKVEPSFLIQLQTTLPDDENKENKESKENEEAKEREFQTRYLECDYANIKQMCEELEKAADQIKSIHCRRIFRYVKN